MIRLPLGLVLMLMLMLLPLGAWAQPLGIAFVQAPEQSSGMALGETPQAAFAAATRQCVNGGALIEDCIPTNWCQPAGWSIDLFVMLRDGPHWHEVHCGLPDRELAERVARTLCDTADRDWILECVLVQIHDPDGQAMLKDN